MLAEKSKKYALLEAVRKLLQEGKASSQEEIRLALLQHGFDVNQSKISRTLHKLGATKAKNEDGQIYYCLPKEPAPPSTVSRLSKLILDIRYNETMVVIHTSPGAAQLIARLLDYHPSRSEIMGTVAGDDTVFICPKSVHCLQATLLEVNRLLERVES
jgi:transcriptional regulator of arginine metabolism